MLRGIIFDTKEFSVNDGPGIRVTIFLKGCPLRCTWCHNPEGISPHPQLKELGLPCLDCGNCRTPCSHLECQPFGRCIHVCSQGRLGICGKEVDARQVALEIKRQKPFLLQNNGGVTLSGGEPLFQPEFLFALMAELKPLHLAVETSAYASQRTFRKMMDLADLVMVDLKHMDPTVHARYTGVSNVKILANIRQLGQGNTPYIVRIPHIPGVNDDPGNLEAAAAFLEGAKNLLRVELMPYNVLAGAKYWAIGLEYRPGFEEKAAPHIDRQPFTARGIPCVVL
jgi:pyruvate formate lyase activating enzyme